MALRQHQNTSRRHRAPRQQHNAPGPGSGRVIVVGAGISGLAAAEMLHRAGREVVVLEARERIGGRIATDYSLGYPVELGANWIDKVPDSPIISIASAIGVRCLATNYSNL